MSRKQIHRMEKLHRGFSEEHLSLRFHAWLQQLQLFPSAQTHSGWTVLRTLLCSWAQMPGQGADTAPSLRGDGDTSSRLINARRCSSGQPSPDPPCWIWPPPVRRSGWGRADLEPNPGSPHHEVTSCCSLTRRPQRSVTESRLFSAAAAENRLFAPVSSCGVFPSCLTSISNVRGPGLGVAGGGGGRSLCSGSGGGGGGDGAMACCVLLYLWAVG